LLIGEVIRDGRQFETFRYQFETPTDTSTERIPLIFQRYLRPGEAEFRLRVEDIYGQRFAHARQTIEVPSAQGLADVRARSDLPVFSLLEEANEAAERGLTTIRLVPPTDGEIQLGQVRFNTVVAGEVDKVTFLLNDRPIMTKREPPYSLELNLGTVAARHRVRVVAYDREGEERARDELLINQGGQRFRVRLAEPRSDRSYVDSLSAVVQVEVPEGATLERVEIFLNEEKLATLYQPPFVQAILLREPGLAYVRAVGYLDDGNSTEDVVFINAPDYFEEVEVQLVELFATVTSKRGEPLLDLDSSAFAVLEDGVEQQIRRFEYVRNLPIHATLVVDTSGSMTEGLDEVTDAARAFAEQTIAERDRLALVSFDTRPRLDVKFTNDQEQISAALDGLRASGSTALYDSLIYALHYFDGVKGQKALLLLSDGVDEASRFAFENALETARRAGVTVYVIGLKELAADRDARRTLRDLANATGGRAFFLDSMDGLPAIYERIQQELRSQYLLVYQSESDKDENEFRRVEVKVKGADVRTIAGYYP
jgi:VWFA-related protein